MWLKMESSSEKIRDSPRTVLPPPQRRSSTKSRAWHSKPIRRDDLLNLNGGYLEIDFSHYRSASCKPVPSRTYGAKIELKRTSVYRSSKEIKRMKNPAEGVIEGRRKIEISRSSDQSSYLSIVDSLCSSDEEGTRKNTEESERDMNKNMKFRCDEIVSRVSGGNGIRPNPRPISKSLSNKLEFPDSPLHLHGIVKFDDRNGIHSFEFSPNCTDNVFVAKNQTKGDAFKSLYTFHCLNGKKRRESESTMVGKMHINSELRNTGGFNSSLVMESVLYGNSSNVEIAAVVIQVPCLVPKSNQESKNGNFSLFKRISKGKQRLTKEEIHKHKEGVSVIIPTGQHGLPKKDSQGPSSLLERWRSGGGCDCGGWDMGCPLTVFGNNLQSSAVDERLFKNMNHGPEELFLQGAKDNTPALTIKLIEEGDYSVDFHAQLSSLQAFSICVSMLHGAQTRTTFEKERKELMQCSCLKMMIEEEVNFLLKEKTLPMKFEENPPLYVINPPFSPIARV